METHTKLGQIQKVAFGWGGYQECMMGLSVTLGGPGWGVTDFHGPWGIERSEHAKWTEEDRREELADTMIYVRNLLKDAKKMHVDQLKGVPVEITFKGNTLESWRILTEVV